MYLLLRVLSDETLKLSYTSKKRTVLDAVKGNPTTVPSRTDHFRSRARALTPFRMPEGVSSDAEIGGLSIDKSDDQNSTDVEKLGDCSSFESSDSAREMALISASFKNPIRASPSCIVPTSSQPEPLEGKTRETDQRSQDAILLEIKEQTLEEKCKGSAKVKKIGTTKRQPHRGVPMREEFFAKIGWTRSIIFWPADPLHNPYMVWCHICKKNFAIRTKGTME